MKGKEKEQLYQKRNYDHYRFSMKELLKYMGQALALCIMADYLFELLGRDIPVTIIQAGDTYDYIVKEKK